MPGETSVCSDRKIARQNERRPAQPSNQHSITFLHKRNRSSSNEGPPSNFLVVKLADTRLEHVRDAGRVSFAGIEAGGQVINGRGGDWCWGTGRNCVDGVRVSSLVRRGRSRRRASGWVLSSLTAGRTTCGTFLLSASDWSRTEQFANARLKRVRNARWVAFARCQTGSQVIDYGLGDWVW
jgi:hypothetical protein